MGEKILIITGGHLDVAFAEEYLKGKHFDRIITADAGLSSCRKLRRMPTDILGDFDSLADKRLLSFYEEQGVPVRIFPTRKDYTDTHLAVACAMDNDPEATSRENHTSGRHREPIRSYAGEYWNAGKNGQKKNRRKNRG